MKYAQTRMNITITANSIILLFLICCCLPSNTFSQSDEHTLSFIGIGVPHTGQCLCGSTAILSPKNNYIFFKKAITAFLLK